MTNEEINRYIHTVIMGRCWHDWHITSSCTKCSDGLSRRAIPGYCSDDSPRRLLNEVVLHVTATVRGWNLFVCKLVAQLNAVQHPSMATAEQIARACVEAHKEGE